MRKIELSAIGWSGVWRPKLLKSATWPRRRRIYVTPAVSPSATACFMRASRASRPALVNPSADGSATAVRGHARSAAGDAAAARVAAGLADTCDGVQACVVTVAAAMAASTKRVCGDDVFTAVLPRRDRAPA